MAQLPQTFPRKKWKTLFLNEYQKVKLRNLTFFPTIVWLYLVRYLTALDDQLGWQKKAVAISNLSYVVLCPMLNPTTNFTQVG